MDKLNGNTPQVVSFNEINSQGCYVTAQGSLLRVDQDAIKEQHSPLITIVSNDDTRVTKISDNPFLPIRKAAQVAANMDLPVNFVPLSA